MVATAVNLSMDDIRLHVRTTAVNLAASADTEIAAAVTGKIPVVVGYMLGATGAYTFRFDAGAAGTALTGNISLLANGSILEDLGNAMIRGTSGASLSLNTVRTAGDLDGYVQYVYVNA